MESGSNSPSVKSFEMASMSTTAVVADVSSPKASDSPTLVSNNPSTILKTSKIGETKTNVANSSGDTKYRTTANLNNRNANNSNCGNGNNSVHNNYNHKKLITPQDNNAARNKKSLGPVNKFRNLICTNGTERLTREFRDVKCSGMPQVRELKLCDNNLFHWKFLLLPDMAPYNKNAFQAEIKFPNSYPQMAPVITVQNIYHPNVDEKGFVCLHCLSHWSRTTKIEDVLQKLFALIRDPEPHHPMRFDVADEYLKDRKVFMHKAFEAAKAFGVPRPKF